MEMETEKVLVSGCFDLLHPGHVAFLNEAASYGQLHVRAGSDQNVFDLKGHRPKFSEGERVYMLNSLECVADARVSSGTGMLDFEPDLVSLAPARFVVNEDGHTEGKQELCEKHGVEYVVLKRVPAEGFAARSSSGLKAELAAEQMPYRLCLAGGWLDQPWVSSLSAGPVVVVQIDPREDFLERAGLATSTRRTALELWGDQLPAQDPEQAARMLFAYENQPGSDYVSGSQDALGLMLPGVNKLNFAGGYWPESIEGIRSRETAEWLSSVLRLVPIGPRPDGYDPLLEQNLSAAGAARLAAAGELAWQGIAGHDIELFGAGLNQTVEAWRQLLPATVSDELMQVRSAYSDHAGSCFSGSGGGYLMVVTETDLPGSLRIQVRV